MEAVGGDDARAKYVILRYKKSHFHGCYGCHANGCHSYKKNVGLVSKQTVLLIHSYHQVHGFYGYNRTPAPNHRVYILKKYPLLNTT